MCGRCDRLETGDVTRARKPGGGTTTRQRLLKKELYPMQNINQSINQSITFIAKNTKVNYTYQFLKKDQMNCSSNGVR